MSEKKAGIFISAGIGDAILLIPMAQYLRSLNYHVVGIITSKYPCEEIFNMGATFDEIIVARTKLDIVKQIASNIGRFENIYINNFAGTLKNFIFARLMSKNIITNLTTKRFKK